MASETIPSLYKMSLSAPCRSVEIILGEFKIDCSKVDINLTKGEQNEPSFIAMNPQHCLPTYKDADIVLWESRAILKYLVAKFGGTNHSLYPQNELLKVAKIDQILYFDIGTLYFRFAKYFYPMAFHGAKEDLALLDSFKEALVWLNDHYIGNENKFLTGDEATIADISVCASLTMCEVANISLEKYDNINRLMKNVVERFKCWGAVNDEAVKSFKAFLESKKKPQEKTAEGE